MAQVEKPTGRLYAAAAKGIKGDSPDKFVAIALDEADISLGGKAQEKIVMIKCSTCGKLNEEDSRFCQECGGKL